jgi:hypothetical protein
MKRLLFLLVLFLASCNDPRVKPGEYIVIPLNQTITPEVIHYSDSSGDYTIYYGTTPTPAISGTPRPTSTPIFPTPTPEVTVLPTLGPTSLPKPTETPNRCFATVTVTTSLNVRATAPSGQVISSAFPGDILTLEARQIISGVSWYQISLSTSQVGWVSGNFLTTPTGNCPF